MALRLAHIYLPKDSSGFLDDLKEKFNIIEHYEIEEKNMKEIKLLLDAEMTEPALDLIENHYGLQEGFRVIVTPVEAVIPRLKVEQKPEIDEENQKTEAEAKRIYREELYEDIKSVSSGGRTFILMLILSAFVAAYRSPARQRCHYHRRHGHCSAAGPKYGNGTCSGLGRFGIGETIPQDKLCRDCHCRDHCDSLRMVCHGGRYKS